MATTVLMYLVSSNEDLKLCTEQKHAHLLTFHVSAILFQLTMSPPPFLYLLSLGSGFQQYLLQGVNFASGGAGLLDSTNYCNVRPKISQMPEDSILTLQ